MNRILTSAMVLIGQAMVVLLLSTPAKSQGFGDGYECSSSQSTNCAGTPGWTLNSSYTVKCCCGSGGPGTSGHICVCNVKEYESGYPLPTGGFCYTNSGCTTLSTSCHKGIDPGNVYFPA